MPLFRWQGTVELFRMSIAPSRYTHCRWLRRLRENMRKQRGVSEQSVRAVSSSLSPTSGRSLSAALNRVAAREERARRSVFCVGRTAPVPSSFSLLLELLRDERKPRSFLLERCKALARRRKLDELAAIESVCIDQVDVGVARIHEERLMSQQ